jgi:hypothetical protein
MADIFDFDTDSFLALPVRERISLCKRFAERAQQLATDAADPKYRVTYLGLAKSWRELADEMARVDAESDQMAERRAASSAAKSLNSN